MRRFLRLFPGLFLLSIFTVVAAGQNNPAPQRPPAQSLVSANANSIPSPGGTDRQILLDVQVTDASGAPVRGLQKQDFTLLDDRHPHNILSIEGKSGAAGTTSAPPIEVVIVIDAVNGSFQVVNSERSELKKFLLRNDGKLPYPTSLIFFTGSDTKVQTRPSSDGKVLAALADQYATGWPTSNLGVGFYGLTERFDLSTKTLTSLAAYEATRPGRKLMIWISPGWPFLSGGNLELTPKDYQWLFEEIVALSGALRQARITLYAVDPIGVGNAGGTRVTYYQDFLKGVPSQSHGQPGNLALQVLAVQSGGSVVNATNNLDAALANCVADADSFYTLTFNVDPAGKPKTYHALGVTVDKPGIRVRTRTGYYAQP
jgi:VWFA-related protein